MTTSTGNFAELLWPGIKEIFGHEYSSYEPLYEKIFEKKTSDKAYEKEQGVTGYPLAGLKDQGAAVSFFDLLQGFQKEYVNVTYGAGGVVTREMYEDDQYNFINQIPRMLARSMRETMETTHFNVLNNGFSSETAADGSSVFNATHSLVGGGTFRNQLQTSADLTETSLEQACIDISDFVDDQNLKIRVFPRKLIVPTALQFVAAKILETTQKVGSADNDVNVVRGMIQGDAIVSPYLTDSDAWFIGTDCPNGLVCYERRAADLARDNEFATENLQFKVTARWSQGVTDPRGIFGSPGA